MPVVEVSAAQRLQDPYAKCGVVLVTWSDGTYTQGSCAVVGRNDILTATHVVYNPDRGGWATELSFYFGADYNSSTGRFDSFQYSYSLPTGTFGWRATAWGSQVYADGDNSTLTSAESQFDVALIGVSKPIGDVTGWFGLAWERDYAQWVTQVGYPRSSTGMMTSAVNASRDPLWGIYRTTTDMMGPGSSGGPIFTPDGYVIGVASSGTSTESIWADIGFVATHLSDFLRSNDDLLPQAPTYVLQAGSATVSEGASALFTLTTTHVAAGTAISYTITGLTASDVAGGTLSGSVTVGANGLATISVAIAADRTTEGAETLTVTAAGSSASVQVLDTSIAPAVIGSTAWTRTFGTSSFDAATAVSAGADGALYVAGYSQGALDGQTPAGWSDAFLTRYDANGARAWTRLLGGSQTDGFVGTAVGADGAIYAAGYGSASLASPAANGSLDVLLARYAQDGTREWVRAFGSSGSDSAVAVATGADGAIHIAGYVAGSIDGHAYAGGWGDGFISRYTADGTRLWTRLIGSAGADSATAIAVAGDGSVFVAGETLGSLHGQPHRGLSDVFVARYGADGARLWTRTLGSSGIERPTDIIVSPGGAVYVVGSSDGPLDGQTGAGNTDAFVASFDANGNRLWTRLLGSAAPDVALSVTLGLDGAIHVGGRLGASLDGQPHAGSGDAFLARYGADGVRTWLRTLGTAGSDEATALATAADGTVVMAGTTTASLAGQGYAGSTDAFISTWRVADPAPAFSMVAHATAVRESASAGFTLVTTGLPAGSFVAYRIAGVTASDILGGALAGTAVVGANGRATILIPIADDGLIESAETMTLWAGGVSASTVIQDTGQPSSFVPPSFAVVSRPYGPYGISPVTSATLPLNTPDLLVARVDNAWTPAFRASTERVLAWYQNQGILREFTANSLLEVAAAGLRSNEPNGMIQVLGIIADADLSGGSPVFDGLFVG